VENERRGAEQHGEDGNAAQWNRDVDHARAAHGLEHQVPEDPAQQVKDAEQLRRRRERTPEREPQGRRVVAVGEDERRKADHSTPDHPAQALIVLRRLAAPAVEQDCEHQYVYRIAREECDPSDRFRAVAERAGETRQLEGGEHDGERRQGALDRPPSRLDRAVGHAQREQHESRVSGGLREGLGDFLGEQRPRMLLQDSIEDVELSRVKPHRVEEESPGHRSRPGPDQPGRR
jgi:hypothetical protein